ncbi:hypothetical protein SAMN05421788_10861 [Filimonas lacunae]|uniref:eRF1 domain-containing protein n=2 Tax=Filimonas lacunae TaxID=477680 RepID=A0A173ME49_9BACT|nr:hypothetical protein FLA_1809 [Filimonas lacunae]SIT28591.1 hypothetical protein SAMN05421788_10861 [Filimonas lacunae]
MPDMIYEEKDGLEGVSEVPGVSIIMPFEPKMAIREELEQKIQAVFTKVEHELLAEYPEKYSTALTNRLREVLKQLDYSTFKQSIAVFVSPVFDKVYYLDIPVQEKVVIDENFEIRDLVASKKETTKFLVLLLNSESSRIFLGSASQFVRIAHHTPAHMMAHENNRPELVTHLEDNESGREKMLEKFLQYVDKRLGVILKVYNLPLFVVGTDRTIGHFTKKTHYKERIISYVHHNYENATDVAIQEAIAPNVANWKKVKERDLLNRIDAAMGAKKLAVGIEEVWKEATHKRGQLLVVEKKYRHTEAASETGTTFFRRPENTTAAPFYIKDAVDDVIEQVLESGGDVEFVEDGVLTGYKQIALIQYY